MILDELVLESKFLSNISMEEIENVQQLNAIFDDIPKYKDVILRVYELYQNGYFEITDHTYFIQLVNDLHYMHSLKEQDLLIILYFYSDRHNILNLLNDDIILEYKVIDEHFKLKNKICTHLLKLNYKRNMLHSNNDQVFRDACRSGYIEVVQYLWQISFQLGVGQIDIHIENDECLKIAQENNHEELVEWILSKF